MHYDNYMELYEAIYLLDRMTQEGMHNLPESFSYMQVKSLGIEETVYKAIFRILHVNGLVNFDGNQFSMSETQYAEYSYLLNQVIFKDSKKQHPELFRKALDKDYFFFDHLSKEELDLYARCNFDYGFSVGKCLKSLLDLNNKQVLELGGNSGGLASALMTSFDTLTYTILDQKIPCEVGIELSKQNNLSLEFIEGDFFNYDFSHIKFDSLVMMNVLHDFDNSKCIQMLTACLLENKGDPTIYIIEDLLTDELRPKEAIMHGLRLAIECRGGRQRTIEELNGIFAQFNYQPLQVHSLSSSLTMVSYGKMNN